MARVAIGNKPIGSGSPTAPRGPDWARRANVRIERIPVDGSPYRPAKVTWSQNRGLPEPHRRPARFSFSNPGPDLRGLLLAGFPGGSALDPLLLGLAAAAHVWLHPARITGRPGDACGSQ
jgi:hypothetical protein